MDGVLLSHLHDDHFDRVARAELPPGTPIVTTPQGGPFLDDIPRRCGDIDAMVVHLGREHGLAGVRPIARGDTLRLPVRDPAGPYGKRPDPKPAPSGRSDGVDIGQDVANLSPEEESP
jgi:hypothetical protein